LKNLKRSRNEEALLLGLSRHRREEDSRGHEGESLFFFAFIFSEELFRLQTSAFLEKS